MNAVETEAREYRWPLTIRIDDELRDALKVKAAQEDRTVASAIRAALRSYVSR